MNIRCPNCGAMSASAAYGEGLRKREDPKWYEPSDEYAEKVCPSCGAHLRISGKSKFMLGIAIAIGAILAGLVWFWPLAWLLLGIWILAIFVVRRHVEFESADK